jgi:hypothetical protein
MPTLTREFLLQRYVEEQRSAVEIGTEIGVLPNSVRKELRRHGIPVRSRKEAIMLLKTQDVDAGELTALYQGGKSPQALSDHFGTTRRRILGQLKRLGIFEESRTYKGDRHWHSGVTLSAEHVQKILTSRRINGSHTGPDAVPVQERFWKYVERGEGCWSWMGSTNGIGYGMIYDSERKRKLLAHRVSWEIHNGSIPDRRVILHRCDNPSCVNPAHLSLGTQAENMQDKVMKGRGRNYFLLDEDVQYIRTSMAQGTHSASDLAQIFCVSPMTVYNVLQRRTHAHVID